MLSDAQLERFVHQGFARIDGAFPRKLADEARAILWRDTGCDPANPATWTRPVIRLGLYGGEPFCSIANAAPLRSAFDRLVGEGRWLPRPNLGTFPVRFPSGEDPGDTGWHVDASFCAASDDADDFLSWRVNVASRGRALLVLFLFSDVGPDDAPTRLRAGSHLDVARLLAPAGEEGLSLRQLALDGFGETAQRPEVLATGEAGTAYLCHPFLVHAAQPHRGRRPRFIAQPPLLPAGGSEWRRGDDDPSPVQQATTRATQAQFGL